MKIAVDARLLARRSSGVRDVCEGLIGGLMAVHADLGHEVILFSDQAANGWSMQVLSGHSFMHNLLPRAASACGADVILVPRQTRPLVSRVPVVPLLHDIGFWKERGSYDRNWVMDATTALALTSRRTLAVSEFTARELVSIGYRGSVQALPIQAIHEFSWRPRERDPYVLVVAVQAPHKNLVRLVEAFDMADTADLRLLIRASRGSASTALREAISRANRPDRIEIVGPLSEEDYGRLLSECWAYVQPSLYEGLCIPLLDMAAAGVPTVASRLGNTGAVFEPSPYEQTFDPRNIQHMADRIGAVVVEESLRDSISSWNRDNVSMTNWHAVGGIALESLA